MNQKTYSTKPKDIKRAWHLVDIKDQVLGRTATHIANLLQGKHKPYFASHLDCGDYVVVINAKQVKLTGRKLTQKSYFRHSGYPGGERTTPVAEVLVTNPARVVETAVTGMLPKNKLRSLRLRRLKVFAGFEHKYQDKFPKEKP